jgi:hypothetical protein
MDIEPYAFEQVGLDMLGMINRVRAATKRERFRAVFGKSPKVCSVLWKMCDPSANMPYGARLVHLLWALLFMKLYCAESVNSMIVGGVDEKTFRKWSWLFLEAIVDLECSVVSFSYLFIEPYLYDYLANGLF